MVTFDDIVLPSNRKFGYFFSIIFMALAVYFTLIENVLFSRIFIGLTLLTFLVTLVKPSALLPFNKYWMRFGFLLGKIISPIVLGTVFFILITPISLLTRLFGRDELRLKKGTKLSYWKERSPIGPEPQSFKNQF